MKKCVCFKLILSLIRLSRIVFESYHTRLITIQYEENSKLQKLKFYAITEFSGMGVQILQMGMNRMRLKSSNSKQYNPIELKINN